MNYTAKTLTGLSIFGAAIKPEATDDYSTALSMVLSETVDTELRCMVFMQHFGQVATSEQDLARPEVDLLLVRIKDFVRAQVRNIFAAAAAQDEADRKEVLTRTNAEFKQRQQPHEMGTVGEIAARFNISKSEVRRRKAEGTLHELMEA